MKILDKLRSDIIGNDILFMTPFGKRHLFYADYTASGRAVKSIEKKIQKILEIYANTHTEDDYTGKYMTALLHDAETKIKKYVNASDNGKIISIGSGCTGALARLLDIIGVYIPSVTKDRIYSILRKNKTGKDLIDELEKQKPIVFITPYEHHTNELMWREAFVEIQITRMNKYGELDIDDLKKQLENIKDSNRLKILSFSAGSNITGLKTEVYKIAKIAHENNAFIFYDYAAIAPYVKIDMNRSPEEYFDAIFFSPHKFLGGPATSGILIFNENIYRRDLAPSLAAGGTVDYVGYDSYSFSKDIETREKAGTPPIIQTIKTALVMELKEKIGINEISKIEKSHLNYFLEKIKKISNLQLIAEPSTSKNIPIISFNIKHHDRILHPKLVTKLLNDLFGIQSRAGCSCAGPYGHYLLHITSETSHKYRDHINSGKCGIKPGWVRINLHYVFTKSDLDFLSQAIEFISKNGNKFIKNYHFDIQNGEWFYKNYKESLPKCNIDSTFNHEKIPLERLLVERKSYLLHAQKIANNLEEYQISTYQEETDSIENLMFFYK